MLALFIGFMASTLQSCEAHLDLGIGGPCGANDQGLVYEAAQGRQDRVRALLDDGVDPNEADPEGYTALRCAAQSGRRDVVETLLASGADPNQAQPGSGETALLRAVDDERSAIVRILLDAGADPNLPSTRGDRPLLRAALSGSPRSVEDLLAAGADPDDGGRLEGFQVDERISAPLWLIDLSGVAGTGSTDLDLLTPRAHRRLTRAGPDIIPPLLAAVYGARDTRAVRALLAAGADPDADAFGMLTPVHAAAAVGRIEALQLLLSAGAEPDPNVSPVMETPAQAANRLATAEATALNELEDQGVTDLVAEGIRSSLHAHRTIAAGFYVMAQTAG